MGLGYKPDFYLTANDNDITAIIKKSLVNLTLTDNSGEEIDRLSITLFLPADVRTPSKGAELSLGLGFSDSGIIHKGKFIVDEVSVSGPPRLVSIVANAAPLTKKSAMQTQRTKSFDDLSMGDLVKEISAKHGLEPKISSGLGVLKFEHLDQVNESDMSLLSRLAKKNDAVVSVKNGNLIMVKKDEGKTVTGKPLQVISLTPDQVSSWQCTISSRGEVQKVTAEYSDVASGKSVLVSQGTGEPEIRMPIKYSSKQEAEAAIDARLKSGVSGSNTMSISMPVNPDLLPLVAEGKVSLSGFGDVEDQEWTVRSLEWSLSNSGFSLRINGDVGTKAKKEVKPII